MEKIFNQKNVNNFVWSPLVSRYLPSSSLSGVSSLKLFPLFATGVNDTGGKFAAGVVDTGGNLPPAPLTLAAKVIHEKNLKQKSRDTVPLRIIFLPNNVIKLFVTVLICFTIDSFSLSNVLKKIKLATHDLHIFQPLLGDISKRRHSDTSLLLF
jgi:hypothetical protein